MSFTPTHEWQNVPEDAVLPPGCQIQFDMTTRRKQARLMPDGEAELLQEYAEQEPAVGSTDHSGTIAWAEPVDIIGAPEMVGWPELTPDCLPAPLYRYVVGEAERLNVDPCALAAHALAAVSAVCSDAWKVKPKRHDGWTQQPRIWACVVKDVGQRGTDMIRSAFWPISKIEDEFRPVVGTATGAPKGRQDRGPQAHMQAAHNPRRHDRSRKPTARQRQQVFQAHLQVG
jgi:hypothetical protein